MKKEKWKNNDRVFIDKLKEYKVKCKCGHTMIIIEKEFKICSWCGRKVYRSKKDEFEDKVRRLK